MKILNVNDYHPFLKQALLEDIGEGDITCKLTVPADATASFSINSREDISVAGLDLAKEVFHLVDSNLDITLCSKDGEKAAAGATLLTGKGNARSILTAERTALNLLMQLSGIATLTARYVDAVRYKCHDFRYTQNHTYHADAAKICRHLWGWEKPPHAP